jgi:hypothetical protein
MEELELGQHVMGKKLFLSGYCSRMHRKYSIRWKSCWDSTMENKLYSVHV